MSGKSRRKSVKTQIAREKKIAIEAAEMAVSSVSMTKSYSGPIPDPITLREYDDLVPGAAKTILDAFVAQSSHRQAMENKVIDSDIQRSREGLWLGFAIAVIVTLAGAYVTVTAEIPAQAYTGGVISTTGIASLVGCFVYGTQSRRKERVQKSEIAQSK